MLSVSHRRQDARLYGDTSHPDYDTFKYMFNLADKIYLYDAVFFCLAAMRDNGFYESFFVFGWLYRRLFGDHNLLNEYKGANNSISGGVEGEIVVVTLVDAVSSTASSRTPQDTYDEPAVANAGTFAVKRLGVSI